MEYAAVHVNEVECDSNKVAGAIHFFSKELKVAPGIIGESQPIDKGFKVSITRLISVLKHFVNEEKSEGTIQSNEYRQRMGVHQQSLAFVLKGPWLMKISASIRREKILGSNVATDMFQNYKTSFVWDVTHIPKFIGRDGENNEGRTNVWVHCSEETLTEKDSDLDDSTAIGVGATIRMVDDLAVPDWSFQVQIDT